MMEEDRLNLNLKAFLAGSITLGFFAVIACLLFGKELPPTVRDILLVMIGSLISSYKEITSYFFGTTSASAGKDKTIAAQASQAIAAAGGSSVGQMLEVPASTNQKVAAVSDAAVLPVKAGNKDIAVEIDGQLVPNPPKDKP